MNISSTPRIFVFAKRRKLDGSTVDIYCRIILSGQIIEKSLGLKCEFQDWDTKTNSIKGNPVITSELTKKVEKLNQKLLGAYYILKDNSEEIHLDELVAMAFNDTKPTAFTFYTAFEDLIDRLKKAKESNSKTNIQKHSNCLAHLKIYAKTKKGWSDFPFSKINKLFIEGFVDYLRNDAKCSHNTAMKILAFFKKAYKIGLDNTWVKTNAFANYRMRLVEIEKEFLSEEELERIISKEINTPRLDLIRDLFVFSCFTGMAYIDVKNLKRENISESHQVMWIKINREKTRVKATIPVLEPAKRILDKWSQDWLTANPTSLLLPVLSNQKLNSYLKELADLCSINKNMTFHMARHTFATTITLSNGIHLVSFT